MVGLGLHGSSGVVGLFVELVVIDIVGLQLGLFVRLQLGLLVRLQLRLQLGLAAWATL